MNMQLSLLVGNTPHPDRVTTVVTGMDKVVILPKWQLK